MCKVPVYLNFTGIFLTNMTPGSVRQKPAFCRSGCQTEANKTYITIEFPKIQFSSAMSQQRHLAAILFTDIVGYTALMQEDEHKAVALIKHYTSSLDKKVVSHGGRVLNYYGDGSLCTFPSATEAVICALELQKDLQLAPYVPLRIGLHIGEVFFEDGKALGDGVNIASRIQSLGQANTILFSKDIHDKIKNQPEFKSVWIGKFDFKNVDDPIEVYALSNEGLNVPRKEQMSGKLKKEKSKRTIDSRKIILGSISLLVLAGLSVFFLFFKIR